MRGKITIVLLILVLAFSYWGLLRQRKANRKLYWKRTAWVTLAYSRSIPHPLLVVYSKEGLPYVEAYEEKIKGSEHTRFWLKANDFCPSVILNYFVYPKELRMSLETQKQLIMKLLGAREEPITHTPPKNFEEVVEVAEYTEEQGQ